jgi:hypothetical protein
MSNNQYSFSTSRSSNATSDFLESNSLVAKFAFVLLVLFVFVILFRIGIRLINWLNSPNGSPRLINGMVDATQAITFPQDPSSNGAVTIYRSNNATDGIEFTWSVWILITNLTRSRKYSCIFYKGNNNLTPEGRNYPNNAPGLYLKPDSNTLVVVMNTYNVIEQEIEIPDIPVNLWVNVIIRCENTTLDVYINGTIARSLQLSGLPKQNYGDVYVAMNGGFSGNISNLWYFNYALGTAAIQKIAMKGPNTTSVNGAVTNTRPTDYLSLRWFFYGAGDAYNPIGINNPYK